MKFTISCHIDSVEEIGAARSLVEQLQHLVQSMQQQSMQQPLRDTHTPLTTVQDTIHTAVEVGKEQINVEEQQQPQQKQQQMQQNSQTIEVNGNLQPPHHSPPSQKSQSQNNVGTTQNQPQAQSQGQGQDQATVELKNTVYNQLSKILRAGMEDDKMVKAVSWVATQNTVDLKLVAEIFFQVVKDIGKEGDANNQLIYVQLLNQLPDDLKNNIKGVFIKKICLYLLQPSEKVDKALSFQYCSVLAFMHQEHLLDSMQVSGVAFKLLKEGHYLQGIMLLCKLVELSQERLSFEVPDLLQNIKQFLMERKNQCLPEHEYEIKYLDDAMDWKLF